jgi:hypothetical protein
MSNKKRSQHDRQVRVRAERRNPPDLGKLSRALIALALEQAREEAEAQKQHEKQDGAEGHKDEPDAA